ncbi:hypothetical protein G6F52_005627 [Rhizopus delemar]|nr:hypothetical protein G6F52_005627 [Rhizopus delemar]
MTKNRKSLLHSSSSLSTANIAGPTSIDNGMPTVFKSSIWRPGHGPGSVFLDMTGRKETKIEFLRLIAQQYPSRVGVLIQQVGSLKFAEINFDPADECCTNGVKFADNSLIIPCRAMDNHMQVVRLRLSNLPFFGHPVRAHYWYLHREYGFYAVWNQMPVYCRYCFYLAAECSCDKPSKKARKQPAVISRLFTLVESIEITPPTEQFITSDKDIVPEEPMVDSSVDSDITTLQAPVVGSPMSSYAVNVPAPSNVAIATTSRKSHNPKQQSRFIRYLRSLQQDIMTFQETHISDTTRSFINTQFQARYSMTYHCGIVSFNPSFILSDNMMPEHDRMILTKVTHSSHAFAPFFILVLYAPASSGRQRQQFFDQVFELLHAQDLDINFDRLLITGDFNYSYARSSLSSQTSLQWISFLEDHFYNTLKKDGLHELPTFRRNESIFSTIDYIFVSQAWCLAVMASNLHKLNASWTDHSMLSVTCCVGTSPSGPGLWRGKPILARKSAFQQYLQ